MSLPRLFVPATQLPRIIGDDVHYLKAVMRLKPGDELEIFDGTGKIHLAKIESFEADEILCRLLSWRLADSELPCQITLAQALPKGQKMDFIIEKGTELGVHQIIPLLTERTIAQKAKPGRWQKLAKEAAEQSGRAIVPTIKETLEFAGLLRQANSYQLAIIPWELERKTTLRDILTTKPPKNILIVIGPEGGFSQAEISAALAAGIIPVSLGKRILRTETAALATLAVL